MWTDLVKSTRFGLLVALTCAAGPGFASDDPPATSSFHQAILDTGNWILSRVGSDYEMDPELVAEVPTPEEWPEFWNRLEQSLNGDSLEDLAWIRPEAERVLDMLEQTPAARPFADWLRQRVDYAQVADAMLRNTAGTPLRLRPIAPPPRTAPGRRATILPPPLPPKPASPAVEVGKLSARLNRAIQNRLAWQSRLAGRPVPPQAKLLMPRLKSVFREEGVPEPLAWIAEVESSHDPDARSPAGAVGLFQLMPETAKRFGLRLWPTDERKDPEKSARAAAKYLKVLHGRFNSWPLAVAAYNAGEGKVDRAIQRNGLRDFETVASALPVETRMYTPKVSATLFLREKTAIEDLPPPLP